MAERKKGLDDAAQAVREMLEKVMYGESEAALAKALVIAASFCVGTPWLIAAEPLLQRLLEGVNNKAGKDAVAAIAEEVSTEEGYRRVATEVGARVTPVLVAFFSEEMARYGVNSERVLCELTESVGADLVARLALLLNRMEERITSSLTDQTSNHMPLVAASLLTGPTITMTAIAKSTQRKQEVRAIRHGATPRIRLDLTNMSRTDVRIAELYVDVLEFVEIDVVEIWSWFGMMRTIRKYRCDLEPRAGRYRSTSAETDENHYLALSPGELEVFTIDLGVRPVQGLYRFRLAAECHSGGERFVQEFDRIFEFGTYDPSAHVVLRDQRRFGGAPEADLGDRCTLQEVAWSPNFAPVKPD